MAIDPQNPNHVWVGTFAGVWSTQDGGATWIKISTAKLPLPTGGLYVCGFAFDPVSAVTGGFTQGIYCWVYGSGVYHTADAGATWTMLSGGSFSGTMPVNCVRIVVDKFGVAWVCKNASSPNLWNFTVQSGTAFTANAWTNSAAAAANPIWSVSPDPASTSSATQRVIVAGYDGSLSQTTDGGAHWTPNQAEQFNQVATDIPWLATDERYMTMNGCMRFNPAAVNELHFPEGVGVWKSNPPTIGDNSAWGAWSWNSITAGIESLDTTFIISPPGGGIGLIQWDRNWFLITDKTRFPSTYGTWAGGRANNNLSQSVIYAGNGADWAGGNPNVIALACAGGGGSTAGQQTGPGISVNGGVPVTGWSFFANAPPGLATGSGSGAIAVSTPQIIMEVANGLYITLDGGATPWSNVTPAGSSGWTNGFAQISQQLAADKVVTGWFVAVDGNKDVYWTSSSGASWTKVSAPFTLGSASGGTQIKAIPYNPGHFFFSAGASFGATVDTSNIFYRSSDGGKTWSDVSQAGYTVREVWVWGYGAPRRGGLYPIIFIYGYVNSVLGVWKTEDNCVSWQKIGDAQFGGMTFDNPNCMAGDMNAPGVVYAGFLGSGYLQLAA
jgi:xyloglucan-specific exo-beta-1,4-glucanase